MGKEVSSSLILYTLKSINKELIQNAGILLRRIWRNQVG